MSPDAPARPTPSNQEVELKFALPGLDARSAVERISAASCLAGTRPKCESLVTTYFDTPDRGLQKARAALRVRQAGTRRQSRWVQTFKTASSLTYSALSRRGEWEAEIRSGLPELEALQTTPWVRLDPMGSMFALLQPCFAMHFERTLWRIEPRPGWAVEVALDLGKVVHGNDAEPICELEVELRSGPEQALFEVARDLSAVAALLPLSISKAERGYRLAAGNAWPPRRASPLPLRAGSDLSGAPRAILAEMFAHFTENLHALLLSDDPELVHQARVGWRRLRSGWRLFAPVLRPDPPSWESLRLVLHPLGRLRDCDVVRLDVLPALATAWIAGSAAREARWAAFEVALDAEAGIARARARRALGMQAVSGSLLEILCWLQQVSPLPAPEGVDMADWARRRLGRMDSRLQSLLAAAEDSRQLHRARILAKRLRYGAEALRGVLPQRHSRNWYAVAADLQSRLGRSRDLGLAVALAEELGADTGIVEFLRGASLGRGALA